MDIAELRGSRSSLPTARLFESKSAGNRSVAAGGGREIVLHGTERSEIAVRVLSAPGADPTMETRSDARIAAAGSRVRPGLIVPMDRIAAPGRPAAFAG